MGTNGKIDEIYSRLENIDRQLIELRRAMDALMAINSCMPEPPSYPEPQDDVE